MYVYVCVHLSMCVSVRLYIVCLRIFDFSCTIACVYGSLYMCIYFCVCTCVLSVCMCLHMYSCLYCVCVYLKQCCVGNGFHTRTCNPLTCNESRECKKETIDQNKKQTLLQLFICRHWYQITKRFDLTAVLDGY